MEKGSLSRPQGPAQALVRIYGPEVVWGENRSAGSLEGGRGLRAGGQSRTLTATSGGARVGGGGTEDRSVVLLLDWGHKTQAQLKQPMGWKREKEVSKQRMQLALRERAVTI